MYDIEEDDDPKIYNNKIAKSSIDHVPSLSKK